MRLWQRDLENELEDGLNAVGRGPFSTIFHASHCPRGIRSMKIQMLVGQRADEVLDIINWAYGKSLLQQFSSRQGHENNEDT